MVPMHVFLHVSSCPGLSCLDCRRKAGDRGRKSPIHASIHPSRSSTPAHQRYASLALSSLVSSFIMVSRDNTLGRRCVEELGWVSWVDGLDTLDWVDCRTSNIDTSTVEIKAMEDIHQ